MELLFIGFRQDFQSGFDLVGKELSTIDRFETRNLQRKGGEGHEFSHDMSFLSNFKECTPFREVGDALFFIESGYVMLFASSGIGWEVVYLCGVGPFCADDDCCIPSDGRCMNDGGCCMTVVETPESGVFTGALTVANNCLNRDDAD